MVSRTLVVFACQMIIVNKPKLYETYIHSSSNNCMHAVSVGGYKPAFVELQCKFIVNGFINNALRYKFSALERDTCTYIHI